MSKLYKGKIPFHDKGNPGEKHLYSYEGERCFHENNKDWTEENEEFEEKLRYVNYGRGRSSVEFFFENTEGTLFVQMFVSDMDKLLKTGVSPLEVNGRWRYCKKGSNYGVQLVELLNLSPE